MPSVSKAQQHFMGMEYGKKKAGKKTDVDMTRKQLKEFAATKTKDLPGHVKRKK
jgi:ribosomal protein L11